MRARRIERIGLFGFVVLNAMACGPAVSSEESSTHDQAEGSRHEIVGGSTTSNFPATGALTHYGSMHCTGTLIAPRKVLTAAHCLQGVSPSALRFVIGSSLSTAQAVIPVSSISAHPQYDDWQLTDDIGYVTLTQDAPVTPMKIVPSMDGSWVGKNLIFVGYGITSGHGSGSGTKRSVTMPIAQVWASQFEYQTPGKNTCNGDSGGPAFAQIGDEYFVAGVTSYGDSWCQQYGVDTRADVYAAFLGVPAGGGGGGGAGGGSGAGGGGGGTPPPDPCQGETFVGRCAGNTVIWCEAEQVKSIACQTCGYDTNKNFYNCL